MLHRAAPLIRVEFGGVEKRRIFPATAPFHFIERVHTEVNEERPLKPHPRRLIRARQNFRRFLAMTAAESPSSITCSVACGIEAGFWFAAVRSRANVRFSRRIPASQTHPARLPRNAVICL
jgi:hypothetical protein